MDQSEGKDWPDASNVTSVRKLVIFICELLYLSHSDGQFCICKTNLVSRPQESRQCHAHGTTINTHSILTYNTQHQATDYRSTTSVRAIKSVLLAYPSSFFCNSLHFWSANHENPMKFEMSNSIRKKRFIQCLFIGHQPHIYVRIVEQQSWK